MKHVFVHCYGNLKIIYLKYICQFQLNNCYNEKTSHWNGFVLLFAESKTNFETILNIVEYFIMKKNVWVNETKSREAKNKNKKEENLINLFGGWPTTQFERKKNFLSFSAKLKLKLYCKTFVSTSRKWITVFFILQHIIIISKYWLLHLKVYTFFQKGSWVYTR